MNLEITSNVLVIVGGMLVWTAAWTMPSRLSLLGYGIAGAAMMVSGIAGLMAVVTR